MLGGRRAAFDSLHPRRRRPAAGPLQQGGDGGGISLRQRLDGAVGEIAHPAGHAQPQRLAAQGVAEADALHASTYAQSNCL